MSFQGLVGFDGKVDPGSKETHPKILVFFRLAHYCSRKEGPFSHKKDTKLTLFRDHDTCRRSCSHCRNVVFLDLSYILRNGMSKSRHDKCRCKTYCGSDFHFKFSKERSIGYNHWSNGATCG